MTTTYHHVADDVEARILAEATASAVKELRARRPDVSPSADGLVVVPADEWATFRQQRLTWCAMAYAELGRRLADANGVKVAELDQATRSPAELREDAPAEDWRPADA